MCADGACRSFLPERQLQVSGPVCPAAGDVAPKDGCARAFCLRKSGKLFDLTKESRFAWEVPHFGADSTGQEGRGRRADECAAEEYLPRRLSGVPSPNSEANHYPAACGRTAAA